MSAAWPKKLKHAVPAPLRRWLRRRWHGAIFSGDFLSWAEARAVSGGYDADVIFGRTLTAARAVRDGRAAWERDTVLFHEPAAHPPLLDALRAAAAALVAGDGGIDYSAHLQRGDEPTQGWGIGPSGGLGPGWGVSHG